MAQTVNTAAWSKGRWVRARGSGKARTGKGFLAGRESGWAPGVGDGQGGLACCDSWGRKESDTTERLNWADLLIVMPLCKSLSLSVGWIDWLTFNKTTMKVMECHFWISLKMTLISVLFSTALWLAYSDGSLLPCCESPYQRVHVTRNGGRPWPTASEEMRPLR